MVFLLRERRLKYDLCTHDLGRDSTQFLVSFVSLDPRSQQKVIAADSSSITEQYVASIYTIPSDPDIYAMIV